MLFCGRVALRLVESHSKKRPGSNHDVELSLGTSVLKQAIIEEFQYFFLFQNFLHGFDSSSALIRVRVSPYSIRF